MPITDNGSIEYSIPKNIKKLITKEFCIQFVKELHCISGLSLEDFDYDSVGYWEGTGGWMEAFANACRKTKNDELLKYYYTLEWFDSDLFDCELTNILIEHKLLLPTTYTDEIARQIGISDEDIGICDDCGKAYNKKDMIERPDEWDDHESIYLCKNCLGIENVAELTFDKFKAIHDILGLSEKDYFICESCNRIHHIRHKGEKYCINCELKQVPNTNVNTYYRESCDINEKYVGSLIPRRYTYKDYETKVLYSYEDNIWYGSIKAINNPDFKDLVTFHSDTYNNIEKEFKSAVDDYLDFKEEIRKESEKP